MPEVSGGPREESYGGHGRGRSRCSFLGLDMAVWSCDTCVQRKGNTMHARVSTLTGSPDQADAGISDFREKVLPWIKEQGGNGGMLLIDRETGRAIAVTLWGDEAAMQRSEESANEQRRRVSEQMRSTEAATVERYEVAVFEV